MHPTIVSILRERAAATPGLPALRVKRQGIYDSISWGGLANDVDRYACGFLRMGITPGDRVAQLSENRYEWILTDQALQMIGAIHVSLHAALSGEQAATQIRHSGARVLLLSNQAQAEKLIPHIASLPDGVRCFSYDPGSDCGSQWPIDLWSSWISGTAESAESFRATERRLADTSPDHLATILYTSGTTGQPKGVMLTHANLVFDATAMVAASEQSPDDVKLNFLPLSHIYGRTSDLYTWIVSGHQLALAESRETVLADCTEIRPTWINGVPYSFEKIRRHLQQLGQDREPNSLRELLGGRIRTCHSGGAPLPLKTWDFYWSHGVPLFTGYGLTETSPVISTCSPRQVKPGSVGKPLQGVAVRIARDGEVLTSGPHVMIGYWNDPSATADALRNGWLHTGDLGNVDDEGFLVITGRKKELIITTGGRKVIPTQIESLLAEDPLIEQAVVIGDGRDYIAALIVPDQEELAREVRSRGIAAGLAAQWFSDPRIQSLVAERVRERLAGLSPHERIRKFVLLTRRLTVETGELTPKMSPRRDVIEERFAAEIALLYP
jgi:long-chain acyl-CoA synthetase